MNETSSEKKDTGRSRRLAVTVSLLFALGMAAGAAIGAARIYGGVEADVHAGTTPVAASTSAACTETRRLQQAVEPALTGDVAAMVVRDDPEDLSGLSFNDGTGEQITLADTGGKLRLINLWATWCAPCREEMPWLDTLQAERGGDDFEVVAISVDGGSDDKPRAFLDEIGIEHLAFYHDPTIGVFNRMRRDGLAFGLPVTLLVDAEGCVIANMNGPAHWSSPDAFALVDAALAAQRES